MYLKVVLIWLSFYGLAVTIWSPILVLAPLGGAYSRTGDWYDAIQLLVSHWYYGIGMVLWFGLYTGLPFGVGRANKVVLGLPKYARRNFYSGAVISFIHFALMIPLSYLFDEGPTDVFDEGPMAFYVMTVALIGTAAMQFMFVTCAYSEFRGIPDQGSVLSNEWRHWRLMMRFMIQMLVIGIIILPISIVYHFLTR